MATAKIEAAMPTDASSAAVLAAAKRAEYAKYSPVFWRIEGNGYTRGASWWVHPVTPRRGTPPELRTIEAVLGQAPPVMTPEAPPRLLSP
jgi:hypothetical protein